MNMDSYHYYITISFLLAALIMLGNIGWAWYQWSIIKKNMHQQSNENKNESKNISSVIH